MSKIDKNKIAAYKKNGIWDWQRWECYFFKIKNCIEQLLVMTKSQNLGPSFYYDVGQTEDRSIFLTPREAAEIYLEVLCIDQIALSVYCEGVFQSILAHDVEKGS